MRIRVTLVQKNFWHAINPSFGPAMDDTQKKTNKRALTFLFLVVEDWNLDDIGACECAKEAWQIMEDAHSKFGLLHALQLMRDLVNIKLTKGEAMKDYIGCIMDIHRKLEKCTVIMDTQTKRSYSCFCWDCRIPMRRSY